MSLTTKMLRTVERRIPKVIDARAHGALDYLHAGFFLGLAWYLRRRQPRAAVAAAATGSFLLAQSLLTDYPLGASKIIPFSIHGQMDTAFAAASMRLPKIFGFEGTAASKIFKGNSAVEGAVIGLTDWSNERARLGKVA